MFFFNSFPVLTPTANITSSLPTITVGSSVILTCTVAFNPSVDVPVTVDVVWTGPNGFMIAGAAQPLFGSTALYQSDIVVTSFGKDQSGDYTCAATINSSESSAVIDSATTSSKITLTVGIYVILWSDSCLITKRNNSMTIIGTPAPLDVQASQVSPSEPVEVSWSPPSDGVTTITGYRIFYGNGDNASVTSDVTLVGLTTNNVSYIGQTVTVCTEIELLASPCMSAVVIGKSYESSV